MLSKLLRALRVFLRSLLGERSDTSLPEPTPRTPTLPERFGKPLPSPGFEIATPLAVDACVHRLGSALGRGKISLERPELGRDHGRGSVSLRLRMNGRYRLPGPLQRQVVEGMLDPRGRDTRLVLYLAPAAGGSGLARLLSSVAIGVVVAFVFLAWITGPADVSLLAVTGLSVVVGAIAGTLGQGVLNTRGNLKERRRLSRAAARLADLLDGAVVAWP